MVDVLSWWIKDTTRTRYLLRCNTLSTQRLIKLTWRFYWISYFQFKSVGKNILVITVPYLFIVSDIDIFHFYSVSVFVWARVPNIRLFKIHHTGRWNQIKSRTQFKYFTSKPNYPWNDGILTPWPDLGKFLMYGRLNIIELDQLKKILFQNISIELYLNLKIKCIILFACEGFVLWGRDPFYFEHGLPQSNA